MYQHYVEHVWKLHRDFDNMMEFALGLTLHASFYSFNTLTVLEQTDALPAEPERLRKQRLMLMAIDAFDQAEAWERAARLCQDLVPHPLSSETSAL